jgi:Bacterial extracellular solute-binding proteins, family 3
MNLAYWVLVGGAAGVLAGLFFGSSGEVLRAIGSAYVMLLEAAVYLYLICSLLHGLGSLEPAKAWWGSSSVAGSCMSQHGRFTMALLLPALAFAVIAWAGPQAHGYFASGATTYPTLALDPALTREVRATIYRNAAENDQSGDAAVKSAATGTTTGDIHLAGVLRVGYNASVMPFCYVNDAGDLVGFDVAQAYTLARALNVRLVFIPFRQLLAGAEAGRRLLDAGSPLLDSGAASCRNDAALEHLPECAALDELRETCVIEWNAAGGRRG